MSSRIEEIGVGLVVDDVADPDESAETRPELEELSLAVVRSQVDPADHAGEERVMLGQLEDPAVFLEVVLGLDEDRPADSLRARISGSRSSGT